MPNQYTWVLPPHIALDTQALYNYTRQYLKIGENITLEIRLLKRSIDARQKDIKVNLQLETYINETPLPLLQYGINYPNVSQKPTAIVVGAGPAGLFCALRLIELGIKPIVIERGKDVRGRRFDLADINKKHIVNPESNYCFGEGGAGTYSDGKLYTRSNKRGDIRRILEVFVAHGAVEDILIDAHPHIGTNKLPKIVQNLRETIINSGGEVHFDTKVTDFIVEKGEMRGVIDHTGKSYEGIGVILATGHSARDIFEILDKKNIKIEFKPFALGVRVEHLQSTIDQSQYRHNPRPDYLPASSYSLVHQVTYKGKQRGVFSFCMCPGGFIVPASTAQGEVVVNGMSPSRRDSKYANSGIVVSIDEEEVKEFAQFGALAGVYFQKSIEEKACQMAGNTQKAPAQRLLDFVENKISPTLNETSYQPGLISVDMTQVLTPTLAFTLKEGFKEFGKKIKNYLTNDAQIVGVESRTSSPIRIPRHKDTFEHTEIARFFPCGEGAGYAGGIVSAGIDGEKCAEKLFEKYYNKG